MNKSEFDQLPEETVATESEKKIKENLKPSSDYLGDYFKSLGKGEKELLGVETGIPSLDERTFGLRGLIVLGGPPKMGKTSFALQLAYEACLRGTPILFYSLEMTKYQLFTRILSRIAEINYVDILLKGGLYLDKGSQNKNILGEDVDDFNGLPTQAQVQKLLDAGNSLKYIAPKFYIREQGDAGEINFESLRREINFIKTEYKTDKVLVIVDHLQVFPIDAKEYHDTLTKENILISKFNNISKETGVALMLISQVNKAGLNNPNAKSLSDIKGSVDNVYIPHFIMNLKSDDSNDEDDGFAPKKLNLHVTSRDTRSGTIKLIFRGEYSDFRELEPKVN
jgi:replicative DNA helicase